MAAPHRRVLVVRDDRLGDWVLTLPLLDAVKAAWPDVHLAAMGTAAVTPLLERYAAVDEVVPHPGKGLSAVRAGAARVRAGRYDAAVIVHPELSDTLMIWFAGVRVRVGNGYRGYSFLYNRRLYFHRSPSDRHEVEYNLVYLEGLGLPVPAPAPAPRLAVTEDERARAHELLKKYGVGDGAYIVIHPGSAGSALEWSPPRYRTLAAEIGRAFGLRVVVTGGARERELAAAVAGESGRNVNLAGETNLPTLFGVLAGARLYISGATGPMHVAAAAGTPVVALFPPFRVGAPRRWRPYADAVVTLVPAGDFACETCARERCSHYNCLEAITVEEVLAAARRLLGGSAA